MFKWSWLYRNTITNTSTRKVKEAEELYNSFEGKAILDDRDNMSMGAKMKDCKILGTPYMVILGDKVENGKAELENTKTGEKEVLELSEIKERLLKK